MLFVITEIHLLLSKNCDKGKNLVNIDKSRFTMNSILTFKKSDTSFHSKQLLLILQ